MKSIVIALLLTVTTFSAGTAFAQKTVVVNDPTKTSATAKPSAAEQAIFDRDVLPKVKKRISADVCEGNAEVAGVANGAFSRAGAKQSLIFYQYCQTGNGFGWAGLVLIENGKLVAHYISAAAWTVDIGRVADVNQNGLDEFTLHWSGGMHQGQGGVGVDLMEFSGGLPKGIGWYKAEEFADTEVSAAWKLTAKPGKQPVFYVQKFTTKDEKKWRTVGKISTYKLGKTFGKFEVVK